MELPEAAVLARQLNESVRGKTIRDVQTAQTPHKFAWYYGDPAEYVTRLQGKTVGTAVPRGGMVEILVDGCVLVFGEGTGLRYLESESEAPSKHQLLVTFDDSSALVAVVRMYGNLWCFPQGTLDNSYYQVAVEKPSPLDEAFDAPYFQSLFSDIAVSKASAKAFLATEQRIPGLGNGVLQDILFAAKVHPKRKISELSAEEREVLYYALKTVLGEMKGSGGRDTEKDLWGRPGGYATKMSRRTVGQPCPQCGQAIVRASYLGGSVYYCGNCQPLE